MKKVNVTSGFFLAAAIIMGAGMTFTHMLISCSASKESAMLTPLESGFVTTGKVCTVFSLQLLVFLILLLILDLETIFIISSILVPGLGEVQKMGFLLLVIGSLWAEWEWGKLVWAL